jgi:hypothetical protein
MRICVPEAAARALRARARALGLTVSKYLATLVRRESGEGWPEGYFDDVVGGWGGEPLRRPSQGSSERREKL